MHMARHEGNESPLIQFYVAAWTLDWTGTWTGLTLLFVVL